MMAYGACLTRTTASDNNGPVGLANIEDAQDEHCSILYVR
jgi:hypothetical protein